MGVSYIYPNIDFTLIDCFKIPDGAALIGLDTSNEGRLCKMDNYGVITIIEDGGLSLNIESGIGNTSSRPPVTAGTNKYGEIRSYSTLYGNLGDDGFLRLSAGAGTSVSTKAYIDISGYSSIPDMNSNIVLGTSGVERMRIDVNGEVGVSGDISMRFGQDVLRARGNTYSKILETGYDGPIGQDFLKIYTAGDGANNATPKITILRDGYTGIGTTTPTHRLEVYNGWRSNSVSYALATAWIGGLDVGLAIGNYDSAGWGTWLSSMRINSDEFPLTLQPNGGHVGIGTLAVISYTLQVNGRVAGTGAYLDLSDKRFKKDILPIENALSKIMSLNGVTYNWDRSVTNMNIDDENHIGLLAQEVELILPQAVSTGNDQDKIKSVAYTSIVPVLIEAIKEQQQIIEDLKTRLTLLESK